jgi:hypothetical protein
LEIFLKFFKNKYLAYSLKCAVLEWKLKITNRLFNPSFSTQLMLELKQKRYIGKLLFKQNKLNLLFLLEMSSSVIHRKIFFLATKETKSFQNSYSVCLIENQ